MLAKSVRCAECKTSLANKFLGHCCNGEIKMLQNDSAAPAAVNCESLPRLFPKPNEFDQPKELPSSEIVSMLLNELPRLDLLAL